MKPGNTRSIGRTSSRLCDTTVPRLPEEEKQTTSERIGVSSPSGIGTKIRVEDSEFWASPAVQVTLCDDGGVISSPQSRQLVGTASVQTLPGRGV